MQSVGPLYGEVKIALRGLAGRPVFACACILTLAIAIGGAASVFGVADPLLNRRLPVPDPGGLVLLRAVDPDLQSTNHLPEELYRRLAGESETLAGVLGAYGAAPIESRVFSEGGEARADGVALGIQPVTGNYFALLGAEARVGRRFDEADDRAGADLVGVLSHAAWRELFGADVDVIGQTWRLDLPSEPAFGPSPTGYLTVVGVAPPGFFGIDVSRVPDLWVPLGRFRELLPSTSFGVDLRMVARRMSGVGIGQVQSEVDAFSMTLSDPRLAVDPSGRPNVRVEEGARGFSSGVRRELATPFIVMGGAAAVLFLLAIANVGGLMLTRARSRRRETAIRLALGASRGRILATFFAEGLVLSAAGASLGLIVARWGALAIASYLPGARAFHPASFDYRMLVFLGAAALLTTVGLSILPGLRASRLEGREALGMPGRRLHRSFGGLSARRWIVTGQIALSMFVLLVTGLLVRTVWNLRDVDLGFDEATVIELSVADDPERSLGPLYERLGGLSGVRSLAVYGSEGLFGAPAQPLEAGSAGAEGPTLAQRVRVGPGFFETMGIPLLYGRGFGDTGSGPFATVPDLGVVISESVSRRVFGGEDPVGQTIGLRFAGSAESGFDELEVFGVAGDVRDASVREIEPTVYVPLFGPESPTRIAIRAEGDARGLAAELVSVVDGMGVSAGGPRTRLLGQVREAAIGPERAMSHFTALLGFVALLLASVGVYGLLATSVGERTGEIGIRMALGAERRSVMGMFLKETAGMLALGGGLGVLAALATVRIIASTLYGVNLVDPISMAAAALILVLASLAAAWLPARRASRLDPMQALRHE